ncbi:MAG: TonB-dependent receptor [Candidatus Saccharicenans sp.]|nr:TonB-dependent receptor [Candidatus Saccharicenans sp.]
MRKLLLTAIFSMLLMTVGSTFAQINPEGMITGRVSDDQGSPLPGVNVEATSPKLVGKATAVTDANGVYRLMALPSGNYEITFALPGFKKLVRKDIYLALSQSLVLNVTLEPAAIEEEVTVVGQAPLIDVKSTVKGQTMSKEFFLTLPRGRSFDSLISTVPGVNYESKVGGFSMDGASGAENVWHVDGTDVTSIHVGIRAQNVVLELLDEVKVVASGYNAEFGGSMGGVVNVITRSGGNTFHGDFIGFYENNKTYMQGKARDYLRQSPYDVDVYEYVNDDDLYYGGGKKRDRYYRLEGAFNLGGYILKDKLWFFGSFNPIYAQTTALRDFNSRQGPFYQFPTADYYYNGSAKLTAAPIQGLRLSASFVNNFYKYRGALPGIGGTSSSTYQWFKEGYDYPDYSTSFMADYSRSNNLLVSLRAGWHRQNTTNQQIQPPPHSTFYFYTSNYVFQTDPFFQAHPELLHYSAWTDSSIYLQTKKRLYEKISANLDLTYYLSLAGEHAWKAGVQFIQLHEDVLDYSPYPRVYLYWNRTSYALGFPVGVAAPTDSPYYGRYGYYYIRSGWTSPYGGVWNARSNNWALYLQDSWTIKDRLTINFGLRAENEYIPSFTDDPLYANVKKPVNFSFTDKIAPRIGLVYDVFGDSSLKIFGSYGIYYDVMKLYIAVLSFGGWKHKRDFYALKDPDWTQIASSGLLDDRASQEYNNTYAGTLDYLPPSFDRIDPNLKPAAQSEISFGAEKKLMEDLSLSVRLVNKHLIRTIEDVGALEWVDNTLEEIFYICNPGYGYSLPVSQGGKFADEYWPVPKAKRDYYGLNVSLEKRFSHNWQGGINYTLSRVQGNYSGLSSADEDGRNAPNVTLYYDDWFMAYDVYGRVLKGPLPHDRTHYIKAYGSYVFPFGLTVGVTAYGRSGLPLTTRLYMNNRYIYPENRADLGRLPFTVWADIFVEYVHKFAQKYSVAINLQVNNVFNTKTIQSKITDLNRTAIWADDTEILDGTLAANYLNWVASDGDPHPAFGWWATRFGSWSARLGFRFSF